MLLLKKFTVCMMDPVLLWVIIPLVFLFFTLIILILYLKKNGWTMGEGSASRVGGRAAGGDSGGHFGGGGDVGWGGGGIYQG